MLIGDNCSLVFADVKPHNGSSIDPERQGGAHVHSFTGVPFGEKSAVAYACDLGQDKVFAYEVTLGGKLKLDSVVNSKAGAGPRHAAHTCMH